MIHVKIDDHLQIMEFPFILSHSLYLSFRVEMATSDNRSEMIQKSTMILGYGHKLS